MHNRFYDAFWTFGNHEPLTMYRRIGGKSTGASTALRFISKNGIAGSIPKTVSGQSKTPGRTFCTAAFTRGSAGRRSARISRM